MAAQRNAGISVTRPGIVPRIAVFLPMTLAVIGICGVLLGSGGGNAAVDPVRTGSIAPR